MGGGRGERKSATKAPASQRNVASLTLEAMHEDKLADLPTDSINVLFGHTFPIVKESHVRSELPVVLYSALFEFRAQALMNVLQRWPVAAATEDTRPAAWFAREAACPVKSNLEWRHSGSHRSAG